MAKMPAKVVVGAILALLASIQLGAEDDTFIPIQISFVPGIAIPFGYGDVGLELGGVGALTRDVQGAAASGVFTISRSIHGIQANGVFGVASGRLEGLQGSGVFSLTGGAVEGAQLAGVFSVAGGSVSGAQISGVFNIGGDVEGVQWAGVFNIAHDYLGPFQGAGVFNVASGVRGIQLAGTFNIASKVEGLQIAPIVNVAGSVRGLQLGLINIAGNIDGVQLGLVNIAGNGIGGIGLLFDPINDYGWFFWQNGTPRLFTRLELGRPTSAAWGAVDGLVASAGLGSRSYFGSRYDRSPWLDLDLAAAWYVGPSATSLQNDLRAIRDSDGPGWHGNDPRVNDAFTRAGNLLPPWPWPSVSLTLGVPIFWRMEALIGVKSDIDLENWPAMPNSFRTGMDSGSLRLFSGNFHLFTKWFFGFRI